MWSVVQWVKVLGHFLVYSNRMSVQPPGYNPSDSLLQGGTATITPLMGGGGFIEGTPDQSLLQGGNSANIVPLKGGRRLQNKRSSRKQKQRGGADNSPTYTAMAQVVPELPKEVELDILEKKILEARAMVMASAPVRPVETGPVEPPPEPTLSFSVEKAREDAIASGPLYTSPDTLTAVKEEPSPVIPALSENEVTNLAQDINTIVQPELSAENLKSKILEAREEAIASAPVAVVETGPVEPPPEPTLAFSVKKARDDAITSMRVQKAKENIAAFSTQKTPVYATVAEIVSGLPSSMSGGGDVQEITVEKDNLEQIKDDTKLSFIEQFQFEEDIKTYKKSMLPKWKRFNILNQTDTDISKIYTPNYCREFNASLNDTKSIGAYNFDRLVYILPQSTTRILLLPPVNGDTTNFLKCLNFINKKNNSENPNPTLVVIFAPPFFGDNLDDNKQIYAHFLKLKLKYEEKGPKIFLLTQDTLKNVSTGCKLKEDEYVLNMLEPSYIVLPYKRIIENQEVGGIIFSGASANEESIPASRSDRIACISSFLPYSSRNNWFAFPPRIDFDDAKLTRMMPYKVYRFIGDNKTDELNDNTRLYFRLKTSDENEEEADILGIFPSTNPTQLVLENIDYELIQLGGQTYSIRKPNFNNSSRVTDDWADGKFTEDEARMLNDLNFRPEYLKYIFGDEWGTDLAGFLLDLVTYKCYSDTRLLTNAKCDKANDFINKVFEFFLENDDTINRGEAYGKDDIDAALSFAQRSDNSRVQSNSELRDVLETIEEEAGIDEQDIKKLSKNPFEDKKLTLVTTHGPLSPHTFYNIEKEQYGREIYAVQLSNDKYFSSVVYVKAKGEEEAYTLILEELQKLQKEYPSWKFIDSMQKLV